MRIFSGTGGRSVKFTEDFSITIAPASALQDYILSQSVDFNKCELDYMGCRYEDVQGNATLEFTGAATIRAKRAGTSGTTVVNGNLKEYY
jgi:hypothetical protein